MLTDAERPRWLGTEADDRIRLAEGSVAAAHVDRKSPLRLTHRPTLGLAERLRGRFGRHAIGFLLTLAVEGLLVLLLLTLAPSTQRQAADEVTVFSLDDDPGAIPLETPEPAPAEDKSTEQKPVEPPPSRPIMNTEAVPPAEPAVTTPPVPVVTLSPEQMIAADIANLPARPAAPTSPRPRAMGPPNTGTSGDTQRVEGAGPNGEPLYAASWYRRPYDSELSGYLSAASGPGWGMIACRTVADYRVEDCLPVAEYPEGSNIARSVLAAAWQFRVRPPMLRGQPRIGEWVRIRIDYGLQRR